MSQVADDGRLEWTDGPETVGYGIYGIDATSRNRRVRVYVLDRGTELVPLASELLPTYKTSRRRDRARREGRTTGGAENGTDGRTHDG